ncbi:MAG: hypothetical protein J1F12_07285 [Muribaculaceae bacterium]|nr:hypothetical protein [Muribaculaceae bacterium]
MTAKDIISISKLPGNVSSAEKVEWDMPVFNVLSRLLESKDRRLSVMEDGEEVGIIDRDSLLEGLGRLIAPRDDCSLITIECAPQDYSAGVIAHAVEDSDAHLVDLFSTPAENGKIRVTLRVSHSDPTAAVRSLERYDYEVVEAHSSGDSLQSMEIATERLLSLQALMNV